MFKKNKKKWKNRKKRRTRTPSFFFLITEGIRTLSDFIEFFLFHKKVLKKTDKGDGRPIIIIPGFMSDDSCSKYLRSFLNSLGYHAEGWNLGTNKGFDDNTYHKLITRVEEAYAQYKFPITIIGWSLGGAYARVIANTRPDLISEIITLAGPISGNIYEANNVRYLFKLAHHGKQLGERSVDKEVLSYILPTPSVKTTAIYSKLDGVIHWTHCIDLSEEKHVKNIEVKGSHCGLLLNIYVFDIIIKILNEKDRKTLQKNHKKNIHFWEKI